MKRLLIKCSSGVAMAALLAACGGGGGSSSSGVGGGTPVGKAATTVSGTVSLVSLAAVAPGKTKKVNVHKAAGQEAAQVTIRSYSKTDTLLGTYNLTTAATGAFSQSISLSDTGGYVVITAQKAGYADFSKRIDYAKPSAINLKAELAKAVTGTATPDTADSNLVNIGVVKDLTTGVKTVYSGKALKAARKVAGTQVELEMKLDTTQLGGASTVIGQFETFNATDPTQAQYFPGAYRGTDKSSGKSGQLVSMAFDYIDLTTDKGKNVFKEVKKLAKAGKKAAAASVINKVTRWVPTSSCGNLLLQDAVSGNSTWDVAIWSVDPYAGDGTWIKIGDSVVATYNSTTSAYDPVTNPTQSECEAGGYYVDITVTSPEYLEKWWNLDHMVVSTEAPKQVCVSGTIKDQDGKPLTDLWMYMYDNDYNSSGALLSGENGTQSFDYGYAITDSKGAFTINSALYNNTDTDRTAVVTYYDPVTYAYKEQSVTVGLSPNCGNTAITVTKPPICNVKGTLSTVPGYEESVTFYNGGSDYYYNYAYTNTSGAFSAEVPCNKELEVYIGYNWSAASTFNVNGTLEATYESSDTGSAAGSTVTLKPISKVNTPPEVFGYLDMYYAVAGQQVSALIYGWDYDGDFPINYKIKYNDAAGKPIEVLSGALTKTQAESGYVELPLSKTLGAGSYNLYITATDSAGSSSSDYPLGSLLVYSGGAGGFAPTAYLYADQTFVNATDLGTASIPLYAYASDLDGALSLTYTWKVTYNGGTTDVSSTTIVYDPATDIYTWGSDGYLTAKFNPPTTVGSIAVGDGGVFTIQLTVSDGANETVQSLDVKVGTVVTYPGNITIQKQTAKKR